jgi:hypothetical protein
MSVVGSTVFLLPSSLVESRCDACAGEGGIGRRTGGRKHRRPRPRGRRGRSSSNGAQEPLPRPAFAGRERGKGAGEAWPPPQRGHRAAGGSSGRETDGPRSRRPATLGGREGVIKCDVREKKDCQAHP